MRKKLYLSIDLDFWQHRPFLDEKFLNYVYNKSNNTFFHKDHHYILPHVNKCKFDTLINFDYHSDIAENNFDGSCVLNCGTWVNHVKDRKEFIWIYPESYCPTNAEGYCHSYYGKKNDHKYNPFKNSKLAGWQIVKKISGKNINKIKKIIDSFEVVGVSFVLSFEWGGNIGKNWYYRAKKVDNARKKNII